MARRVRRAGGSLTVGAAGLGGRRRLALSLVLFVAATTAAAAAALPAERPSDGDGDPVLLAMSFDEAELPSGPDTYRTFTADGTVRSTSAFRVSGGQAVEIRDVPGDGDFPELQAFFPLRREGTLVFHVELLTTDPGEPFNLALAGPAGFRLAQDGILFWLEARGGRLLHHSDSIPRRLLDLEAFRWYTLDVELDLTAGRYRLRLRREGDGEAVVDLADQPTAASQRRSGVEVVSFIGDRGEDTSAVRYYIDDLVVASTRPARLGPFVAPGRRRLFVERFADGRGSAVAAERPALRAAADQVVAAPEAATPAALADAERFVDGLLAAGQFADAEAYARGLVAAATSAARTPADASDGPAVVFRERAADAALLRGDLELAAQRYSEILADEPARVTTLLALADVRHLQGDVAGERALRERIYGALQTD